MPVYMLEPDPAGCVAFGQLVEKNLDLRTQVFDLAQNEGEEVFLHRYKIDVMGGAPHTLVECSPEFLEKIKKLPAFGSSHDMTGAPETFRAGHAGPVDLGVLNRVLAKESTQDASLYVATWRLHEDIIDKCREKGLQGQVLLRHVDGHRGFLSLICPESFVNEVNAMTRCKAVVKPGAAAKIFHRPPKGPGR